MVSIVSAALIFLSPSITPPSTPETAQLIRDVRLFDGERVREHRSVLIENGVIARVGGPALELAGAEVIDGRGLTLLPGLIDAHVHLPDQTEAASRQALRLGVTTQLDMTSVGQRLARVKRLQAEDQPDLADVRTAGACATAPGGHPTQMGGPPLPATIAAADDAQQFVDARIAEGADYIKIIHDSGSTWSPRPVPTLDFRTLRALVEAAHRRKRIAVVHIGTEDEARRAIAAGADGLAHMFAAEGSSADFGRFAASHRAFVITTFSAVQGFVCGRSQGPKMLADPRLGPQIDEAWKNSLDMMKPDPARSRKCKGADEAMRQLLEARVPIIAGTDAPGPGTAYGASLHGELALLVEHGMTPPQALAAATSVTARHFRLADRGRVHRGLRADLLLVRGDPTTDILATRNIVAVWKRGVRLARTPSAATRSLAPAPAISALFRRGSLRAACGAGPGPG